MKYLEVLGRNRDIKWMNFRLQHFHSAWEKPKVHPDPIRVQSHIGSSTDSGRNRTFLYTTRFRSRFFPKNRVQVRVENLTFFFFFFSTRKSNSKQLGRIDSRGHNDSWSQLSINLELPPPFVQREASSCLRNEHHETWVKEMKP